MEAMRVSVNLFSTAINDSLSSFLLSPSLKFPEVPLEWKTWFCIEPSSITYVQDIVILQ